MVKSERSTCSHMETGHEFFTIATSSCTLHQHWAFSLTGQTGLLRINLHGFNGSVSGSRFFSQLCEDKQEDKIILISEGKQTGQYGLSIMKQSRDACCQPSDERAVQVMWGVIQSVQVLKWYFTFNKHSFKSLIVKTNNYHEKFNEVWPLC